MLAYDTQPQKARLCCPASREEREGYGSATCRPKSWQLHGHNQAQLPGCWTRATNTLPWAQMSTRKRLFNAREPDTCGAVTREAREGRSTALQRYRSKPSGERLASRASSNLGNGRRRTPPVPCTRVSVHAKEAMGGMHRAQGMGEAGERCSLDGHTPFRAGFQVQGARL